MNGARRLNMMLALRHSSKAAPKRLQAPTNAPGSRCSIAHRGPRYERIQACHEPGGGGVSTKRSYERMHSPSGPPRKKSSAVKTSWSPRVRSCTSTFESSVKPYLRITSSSAISRHALRAFSETAQLSPSGQLSIKWKARRPIALQNSCPENMPAVASPCRWR